MTAALAPAFDVPPELEAGSPPETRGIARDGVRLMVAGRGDGRIVHTRFDHLPEHLARGDVLVVNTSRTLPAAVAASTPRGEPLVAHFSSPLPADDRLWVVEPRNSAGVGTVRHGGSRRGDRLALPGAAAVELVAPYMGRRLWVARPHLPVAPLDYLAQHGRPIRYAHTSGAWPIELYQTIFADEPGSAEMPSAARPFTERTTAALGAAGIEIVPVLLHTGVSSLEAGELPPPERFRVSSAAAATINAARARGGRVVAVGTTVVRALAAATGPGGDVRAAAGWTDVVIGPDRPAAAVDGLLTGWHEPGATHLDLIEAIAGSALTARSYEEAVSHGYLWHEFGDVHLIVP